MDRVCCGQWTVEVEGGQRFLERGGGGAEKVVDY